MSIYTYINDFGLITDSAGAVFSVDAVTPGNNTYGSYVELIAGASVTDDSYGILINFSAGAVSGVARDILAKIGVDPAGGSSYTTLISDLIASCAGVLSASNGGCGGINYFFPIKIKAGSSVGVAGSVNNATVGTFAATCQLFCKPAGAVTPRAGSFVRTFGSVAASSNGTAVTPPSNSTKSAYVELGTTSDPLWYWCLGVGCNNAAMNNTASMWDLAVGDASNKKLVILQQLIMPGAVETMAFTSLGNFARTASGDKVYTRAGSNGVSPTGMTAVAYGVGG